MRITVLFFAQARERAGCSSALLELPDGATVSGALEVIAREYPGLEPLWPHLAIAVNGELAARDAGLAPDAELALLPPVSGG